MKELEALARAATPGPWYLVTASDKMKAGIDAADGSAVVWNSDRQWDNEETGIDNEANANFIAAANPTAILALLSELDTLSAKNKALAAERVAGLEEGLSALLRCEYEAAGHGLTDCIDNDGNHYQSAHLEKQIKNAEALVAARTQESSK